MRFTSVVEWGSQRGYYVYALADPRDGEVFYIGKGTRSRAAQHAVEERAGRSSNGKKALRLGEIRRAGLSPTILVLEHDLTEARAFERERSLIRLHRSALTNATKGQRSELERAKASALNGLREIKPLCQMRRERASPERMAVWFEVTTRLKRIAMISLDRAA